TPARSTNAAASQDSPGGEGRPYRVGGRVAVQALRRRHGGRGRRREGRVRGERELCLDDQRAALDVPERGTDVPQAPRPDLPVRVYLTDDVGRVYLGAVDPAQAVRDRRGVRRRVPVRNARLRRLRRYAGRPARHGHGEVVAEAFADRTRLER